MIFTSKSDGTPKNVIRQWIGKKIPVLNLKLQNKLFSNYCIMQSQLNANLSYKILLTMQNEQNCKYLFEITK